MNSKKFFAKVTVDNTAIYKRTMSDGTEVYSNRPGTLIPHSTITLDPQKVAKAQADAAYIMQLFGK